MIHIKTFLEFLAEESDLWWVSDANKKYSYAELSSKGYKWRTIEGRNMIIHPPEGETEGPIVGGAGIKSATTLNRQIDIKNKLDALREKGFSAYAAGNGKTIQVTMNDKSRDERIGMVKDVISKLGMKFDEKNVIEGTKYKDPETGTIIHIEGKQKGSSFTANDYLPPAPKGKPREYSNAETLAKDILKTVGESKKIPESHKAAIKELLQNKNGKLKSVEETIKSLSKCTNDNLMVSFNEIIVPYLILNRDKLTEDAKKSLKASGCESIVSTIESIGEGRKPTSISYPTKSNEKTVDVTVCFEREIPTEILKSGLTEEEIEKWVKERSIVNVSMKHNAGSGAAHLNSMLDSDHDETMQLIENTFSDDPDGIKNAPIYRLYQAMNNINTAGGKKPTVPQLITEGASAVAFPEFEELHKALNDIYTNKEKYLKKSGRKSFLTEDNPLNDEALKKTFFEKIENCGIEFTDDVKNNYPNSVPYILHRIVAKRLNDDEERTGAVYKIASGVRNVVQINSKTNKKGLTLSAGEIDKSSDVKMSFEPKSGSDAFEDDHGTVVARFKTK